jgi:hypothetical protein
MCGQLVVVALGKFVADALAAEFAHGALQSSTVCGRVAIVALEFDVLTRIKILLMCIDASFTRESCGGEGHVAVGWVTNFTPFFYARWHSDGIDIAIFVRIGGLERAIFAQPFADGHVAVFALEAVVPVPLARLERVLPRGRPLASGR